MTPEHSFLYFFHQVMGLGYQMGTQKIGLGPLNKVKTYLEHFRTDKYFFPPKSNFFFSFFRRSEFFFLSWLYVWLLFYLPFMCSMGSQLPIKILKRKSAWIWRCWRLVLCQNVKISYYFSEKIPLFIKTKAKVLKAILYKCICCPLTVYAKISKVFMK